MLFPTVTFGAFLAAVYCVHVVTRTRPAPWKLSMLVASYVFYGWWDWRFCGLLAASTVLNWVFGYSVQAATGRDRRTLVALAVTANLGVLGLFKYYGFFVASASAALGPRFTPPALEILLPIGISFFTFQAVSYVVDIHRQELSSGPLLDFAVYLAFFPQLVAGPIVRATEFLPQLRRLPGRAHVDATEAALLIAGGLFKKVVVASYLAESVVDPVFAAPSAASRPELLLALYGYAVQIYADFSGYTDIAIGVALLLGFRFPTNFDNPYRARSMQDFWRRWHMTLSRWLRDYLYIPLGGSRGSTLATRRNLMITMVLGGLWHGAAWTFALWGAIHGLALVIERRILRRRPEPAGGPSVVIRWAITFHVVALAWIPFRAETFTHAGDFMTGLFTAPLGGPVNTLALAVIVGALAVQLAPRDLGSRLAAVTARLDPTIRSAALGAWLFLVVSLGPDGVAPFIYFRF